MRGKLNLRRILYLTSACVLLAGIVSGLLIYRAAAAAPTDESGYVIVGGFIYQADGTRSKSYTHDLQVWGGNGAVLADDFMHWFLGLWQGTTLAYTVAAIAAFLAFVIYVIGNNVQTVSSPASAGNEPEEHR